MEERHYKILHARDVAGKGIHGKDELSRMVNEAIAMGWRPQGGVVVSKYHYYQAMVREPAERLESTSGLE